MEPIAFRRTNASADTYRISGMTQAVSKDEALKIESAIKKWNAQASVLSKIFRPTASLGKFLQSKGLIGGGDNQISQPQLAKINDQVIKSVVKKEDEMRLKQKGIEKCKQRLQTRVNNALRMFKLTKGAALKAANNDYRTPSEQKSLLKHLKADAALRKAKAEQELYSKNLDKLPYAPKTENLDDPFFRDDLDLTKSEKNDLDDIDLDIGMLNDVERGYSGYSDFVPNDDSFEQLVKTRCTQEVMQEMETQ